jgi:hypothetical protein
MAKRASREWSVEEYEEWEKAEKRFQAVGKAADEVGGPRLSMVPVPDQGEAWPTDLLPPSVPPEGGKPAVPLPFDGLPLEDSRKRLAGWSADRQRLFLTIVAETGQVHLAASAARLSVRSAQALRVRSPAFNEGWRMAEQLATGRLAPIAFDRAINGRIEQVYHEGQLIAERRIPSDKLLMWLLARLDPKRFAMPWEQRGDADPQAAAAAGFQGLLDGLEDTPS